NIERNLAYCRRVSSSNNQEKPDGSKVKLVRGGAEINDMFLSMSFDINPNPPISCECIEITTSYPSYLKGYITILVLHFYAVHASAIEQMTKGKNGKGKEIARLVAVALKKDYKQKVQEPDVKVLNLTIVSAGRPGIVLEIPDFDNPQGLWFTLKEGSKYSLKFSIKVSNEIVCGLK
nr:Rho GDP-dissociation inhibitor 1-like [Tanacetum cinerariifolium]